jgi:hypothetical protein
MSANVGNAIAKQATSNITAHAMTLLHAGLLSSAIIMDPRKAQVPCRIKSNGARTILRVAGTMGCLKKFIDYFDH